VIMDTNRKMTNIYLEQMLEFEFQPTRNGGHRREEEEKDEEQQCLLGKMGVVVLVKAASLQKVKVRLVSCKWITMEHSRASNRKKHGPRRAFSKDTTAEITTVVLARENSVHVSDPSHDTSTVVGAAG